MSIVRQALGLESRDAYPPLGDPWGTVDGKWMPGMTFSPYAGSQPVSTDRAMRVAAVFACLRLLSEAIATLPLDTFQRQRGIRLPYRPRPAFLNFDLEDESRISYLSQIMLSLLTDGNAYIATPRDSLGVPTTLIVLDPCLVRKYRDEKTKRIKFEVKLDGYETVEYTPLDILHIPGMMLPGRLTGLSPIGYARETIGSALAAQEFGRAFFENGATPSANLEFADVKTKEQAQDIVNIWKESHGGSNQGGIGALTGGAKFVATTINQRDAQFIELRQFQVPDIARIFGVPPHLIADSSNSTSWGSGLAEQNLAFGQFSLRPWVERIEEGHGRTLTSIGLPQVFMKLNMDALLRASLKDRYEAYGVGIDHGFLEVNEARSTEDLAPSPAKLTKQDAEVLQILLQSGFDPASAATVLGLPQIKHTGTVPVPVKVGGQAA